MPSPLRSLPGVRRGPDTFWIDPAIIYRIEGHNPRTVWNAEDHADMVASIRQHGVLEPLVVKLKDGAIFLLNGERRWRAVMQLRAEGVDIAAVPARIDTTHDPAEMLVHALVYNAGVPLSPLEEAHAYRRLQQYGHSIESIAQKVGKSVQTVRNRLALCEAEPGLVEEIGVSKAAAVVRKASREGISQEKALEASRMRAEEKKNQNASVEQEPLLRDSGENGAVSGSASRGEVTMLHTLVDRHSLAWVMRELFAYANESLVVEAFEQAHQSVQNTER